jgi:hypothetical protein
MKFFAALSALGLVVGTTMHLSTYWIAVSDQISAAVIFMLLGVFITAVPAIAAWPKTKNRNDRTFREVIAPASVVLRWLALLLFANALVSLITFSIVCTGGSPIKEPDGTYSIHYKGAVPRQITRAEYQRDIAYKARMFTSWGMLGYGAALLVMVSQIHRRKLMAEGILHGTNPNGSLIANKPRVPIWLHKTVLIYCVVFGWLGVPLLMAGRLFPLLGNSSWGLKALILFSMALFSAVVPATLLRRYVTARCPYCGARALSFLDGDEIPLHRLRPSLTPDRLGSKLLTSVYRPVERMPMARPDS